MSRKSRSSKSTRATKRTKRRVVQKKGVHKAKKKSSRKKSKKSIVRKKKTSNNKKNIVMKGGVLEIKCGTKKIKIKIEDAELDAKLLNFKSSDNLSSNPKICIYNLTNTDKTEQYRMYYSSDIKNDKVYYSTHIPNDLSIIQKKKQVIYIPNILYYKNNKGIIVMIEEHFTKSPQLNTMDEEGILDLLIKMAKCVEFLHSYHIVHSRILFNNFKKNEANIIITDFSSCFITSNFEVPKRVAGGLFSSRDAATFENTGNNTAPEVLSEEPYYNNRELLKKRDVFSFGIMLLEIIKHQTTLKIKMTDKLLVTLYKIIVNCINFKPEERYTFTEIIQKLELEKDEASF
jgi:hypothetical protein